MKPIRSYVYRRTHRSGNISWMVRWRDPISGFYQAVTTRYFPKQAPTQEITFLTPAELARLFEALKKPRTKVIPPFIKLWLIQVYGVPKRWRSGGRISISNPGLFMFGRVRMALLGEF